MAGDAVSDMDFFPHRVEHGGSVDMGGFFCVILNSAIWYLRLDILGAGMKSTCVLRVFSHYVSTSEVRASAKRVLRESPKRILRESICFSFFLFRKISGKISRQ